MKESLEFFHEEEVVEGNKVVFIFFLSIGVFCSIFKVLVGCWMEFLFVDQLVWKCCKSNK